MMSGAAPRLQHASSTIQRLAGRRVLLFLDYDGTLAPIVEDPAKAFCPPETIDVLRRVRDASTAKKADLQLAFVSGRAVNKVKGFLEALSPYNGVVFAGSHGFDVQGEDAFGAPLTHTIGEDYLKALEQARKALEEKLGATVPGASVEDNIFSITAHYRNVQLQPYPERGAAEVERAVVEVLAQPYASGKLTKRPGKMVFEIRPDVDWHKGAAVEWAMTELLGRRGSTSSGGAVAATTVICIGDDHTDEDMMRRSLEVAGRCRQYADLERRARELERRIAALEGEGGVAATFPPIEFPEVEALPIIVAEPVGVEEAGKGDATSTGQPAQPSSALAQMPRDTSAVAYLRSPDEVRAFLEQLLAVAAAAPSAAGV